MANGLQQFNPLGQFIAGKQAGLGLQEQQLGLQTARRQAPIRNALADIGLERARQQQGAELRQGDISSERSRLLFLNRAGKALLSFPPEQRSAAFGKLTPLAERVGIPAGTFTADQLTDENLSQLISTTEGFISDPRSLEQQKLSLRGRELEQRRELAFARPELAGLTEAEKLGAQKGVKAEVAGEVTTAKEQAKLSAKIVANRFDSIAKINKNILNIDRAIAALDSGAGTGVIEKLIPSFTKASRELRQIQNELGLDIVGAVTFGALSKGELDLALGTALDLGQSEEALRDILVRKKDAQEKLAKFYGEAIRFLSAPGATIAQFMDRAPTQAADAPPEGVQFLGFE